MSASPVQCRQAARGSAGSLVATVLALVWARLWRGTVRYDATSRLLVVTGMRGGFARGGTTVGGVFLTDGEPSAGLLRHESVHADQWARHGLTFPARYLLQEIGHPGRMNRYEVEAGLKDGGYRERPVTSSARLEPRGMRVRAFVRARGRALGRVLGR